MKNWFIYSIFFLSINVFGIKAEKNSAHGYETIFKENEFQTGGFVGSSVKVSQIGNGVMTLLGARAGVVINDLFTVGAGGYGMLAHSNAQVGHKEETMRLGYGGPSLGFKLFYHKLFHADFFSVNNVISS